MHSPHGGPVIMRLNSVDMADLVRHWKVWRGGIAARTVAAGLAAGLLVAAGVIAWLLRPGPRTSGARELPDKVQVDPGLESAQFRRLPVIPGRHDRIHHDFFRFDSGVAPQTVTADVHSQEAQGGDLPVVAQREAGNEGPRLKAIMMGSRPKALINDVIVSVGEKVKLIANGINDDEFEVMAIDDQTVELKRGGQAVVLRLEPENDGQSGGARSPSER
jgi:hypothetical protein